MHQMWVDAQKQMYPAEPVRQLQRLSDTRWCCRVVACVNIRDRLDALLSFLYTVTEDCTGDRVIEAKGLLALIDFKFVLLLHMFCDLLSKIRLVSVQLQAVSLDTAKAVELVQNLIECLTTLRSSDDFADQLIALAETKSRDCDIEIKYCDTLRRPRKLSKKLSDSIVLNTVGQCSDIDSAAAFRQSVVFAVLDCIIAELRDRFSDHASAIMVGIQALTPNSSCFLDVSKMSAFIKLYGGNFEDISHEVYQLRRLIERTTDNNDLVPCTMLELAKFLEPYKLAFQEMYRLVCIALTLPVSSASCEHSFSAMKLIKSHLRSTMCDSRLSNIAVLSIESARAESLSLDAFVDEFDSKHQNRKLALH